MAMLAEPRRKQKVINLRAKNNAWSNDSTKFGQRMLEKMGWTSGKGLGANENGITEHVIARYKNDDKGLGFEDKNDQWTKHEDDFNALLANLSNASDNAENLHSGISLEDKSKKSKARIHYHKFTRGKDISRYSEKDLANIFGKKSFKNTEENHEPTKEDLKTTEQIFTEKGSMEDYFKNKLAEFKSKSKYNISNVTEMNAENDELDYNFCGFSQETDNTEVSNDIEYNKHIKTNSDNVGYDLDKLKKKKSKKLNSNDTLESDSINTDAPYHTHNNVEGIYVKIKKNKLKNQSEQVDNKGELCQVEKCIDEKLKKKKSKNEKKVIDNDEEKLTNYIDCKTLKNDTDADQTFKTKKKKIKNDTSLCTENKESSKNKELIEDNTESHDLLKKKSIRKSKTHHNIEIATQSNTDIEYVPKKKKKKKLKENE